MNPRPMISTAGEVKFAPAHGGPREREGAEHEETDEGIDQPGRIEEEEHEEQQQVQRQEEGEEEKVGKEGREGQAEEEEYQRQQLQRELKEREQEQEQEQTHSSVLSPSASSVSAVGIGGCENHARGVRGAHVHLDEPPPPPPPLPPPLPSTPSYGPRPRPGSVQRLLEKEGHDARNVVSWLVPNLTNAGGGGGVVVEARGESAGAGGVGGGTLGRAGGVQQQQQQQQGSERASREGSREGRRKRRSSPMSSPFKGSTSSLSSSKGVSSSRSRSGSDATAQGFNQRLWGYLFRNVNRAVDELYYLCEAEGSATHCTEAADLLEGCSRDFSKLVERIIDQKRFDQEQRAARAEEKSCPDLAGEGAGGGDSSTSDSTSRKPKGLVWEVRKTTSASTASAMVLNAIERMESQRSPTDPSPAGLGSGGGRGGRVIPPAPMPAVIGTNVGTDGSPAKPSGVSCLPPLPSGPGGKIVKQTVCNDENPSRPAGSTAPAGKGGADCSPTGVNGDGRTTQGAAAANRDGTQKAALPALPRGGRSSASGATSAIISFGSLEPSEGDCEGYSTLSVEATRAAASAPAPSPSARADGPVAVVERTPVSSKKAAGTPAGTSQGDQENTHGSRKGDLARGESDAVVAAVRGNQAQTRGRNREGDPNQQSSCAEYKNDGVVIEGGVREVCKDLRRPRQPVDGAESEVVPGRHCKENVALADATVVNASGVPSHHSDKPDKVIIKEDPVSTAAALTSTARAVPMPDVAKTPTTRGENMTGSRGRSAGSRADVDGTSTSSSSVVGCCGPVAESGCGRSAVTRQPVRRLNPRAAPFAYNPGGMAESFTTRGSPSPAAGGTLPKRVLPAVRAGGITSHPPTSAASSCGTPVMSKAAAALAPRCGPAAASATLMAEAAVPEIVNGTVCKRQKQKKKRKSRKKNEEGSSSFSSNGNDRGGGGLGSAPPPDGAVSVVKAGPKDAPGDAAPSLEPNSHAPAPSAAGGLIVSSVASVEPERSEDNAPDRRDNPTARYEDEDAGSRPLDDHTGGNGSSGRCEVDGNAARSMDRAMSAGLKTPTAATTPLMGLPPGSKWTRRPRLAPDGPSSSSVSSKCRSTAGSSTVVGKSSNAKGSTSLRGRGASAPIKKVGIASPPPSSSSPSAAHDSSRSRDVTAGSAPTTPSRTPPMLPSEKAESTYLGASATVRGVDDRQMLRGAGTSTSNSRDGNVLTGTPEARQGIDNKCDVQHRMDVVDARVEVDEGDVVGDEGQGGEGEEDEDEEEDPDSAYVNAMEKIWAEAEAWVDAEAQAEEEAWARLPTDVPCCPEGSEGGGPSDVDESTVPLQSAVSTRAAMDAQMAGDSEAEDESNTSVCDESMSDDHGVKLNGGHDDHGAISSGAKASATPSSAEPRGARGDEDSRGQVLREGCRSSTTIDDCRIDGDRSGVAVVARKSDGIGGGEDGGDDDGGLSELEIEIPTNQDEDDDGDREEEQEDKREDGVDINEFAGDSKASGSGEEKLRSAVMESDSLNSWYSNDHLVDEMDSEDEERQGVEEESERKLRASSPVGGGVGRYGSFERSSGGNDHGSTSANAGGDARKVWSSSASPKSSSGFPSARVGHPSRPVHSEHGQASGGGGGVPCSETRTLPRTASGSGASCFRVEEGASSNGTCDDGWGPFSHRVLQKKLSSPQRNPQRKLLSAAEAKLRQERRQMVAELNRAHLASGMAEKLKQHEERVRGVRFRKEEQLLKAEEEARRRMERADARRKEHRRGIVRKANDANSKVKEVIFMNKLTVEDLKITLQMKLVEVDRRIQSGRARRQQLLAGISDRQRKRTRDKAAQMSEKRLEAESAAAMRWEALQKRLEAVQERRRDRERETSRRIHAANRHAQARERRKALHVPSEAAGKVQHDQTTMSIDSRCKEAVDTDLDAALVADNQSGSKNNNSQDGHNGRCDTVSNGQNRGTIVSDCGDLKRKVDGGDVNDTADNDAYPDSSRTPDEVDACHDVSRVRGDSPSTPPHCHRVSLSSAEAAAQREPGSAATSAEAANAVLLRASACQKRGRAQKKRARKVKDKMRQLCLEVRSTQADMKTVEVAPWPRLERAARDVEELVLARTKLVKGEVAPPVAATVSVTDVGRCQGVKGLNTATVAAMPRPANTKRTDVKQAPSLTAPIATDPPDIAATSNNGTVATVTAEGVGDETLIGAANAEIFRAAVPIARNIRKGNDSQNGGGSDTGVGTDKLLTSVEKLPSYRKTRRGKRAGGTINRRRRAKERVASKRSAGETANTTRDEIPSSTAKPPATDSSVFTTRDLGEEDDGHPMAEGQEGNGKRGSTDEAAESIQAAAVAATATIPTDHDDAAPFKARWDHEPKREMPATLVNGVDKKLQPHLQEQHLMSLRSDLKRVETVCAEDEELGAVAQSETKGSTAVPDRGSSNVLVGRGDARMPDHPGAAPKEATWVPSCEASIPCRSSTPQSSSPSQVLVSLDITTLECSALHSLRDLRAMCLSSGRCSPSMLTSARAAPGSSQSLPPRSSSSSSTGSAHDTAKTSRITANRPDRLLVQLRARGLLESLVALCAPFPWAPVPLPLQEAKGLNRRKLVVGAGDDNGDAAPTTGGIAGADATQPAVGILSAAASVKSRSPESRVERAAPQKFEDCNREDRHHTQAYGGRETETKKHIFTAKQKGAGSSEGARTVVDGVGEREAMTECALAILLAVTSDVPSNRDHVLRMDGGAPLVDCLSRLLERATRHGDTTKDSLPLPRLPPIESAAEKNGRNPISGESSTTAKAVDRKSTQLGSTRSGSDDKGQGFGLPLSTRALCEREVGTEVQVEEALLSALAIISLLVCHEASDESTRRIQEALVRYLMAKGLLFDLSVLVHQLHPFCAEATPNKQGEAFFTSSVTQPRAEEAVGSQQPAGSDDDTRCPSSPPSPRLSSGTMGCQSPVSGSSSNTVSRMGESHFNFSSARPSRTLTVRRRTMTTGKGREKQSPLGELAGRIAELVEGVLRPSSPSTPSANDGQHPKRDGQQLHRENLASANVSVPLLLQRGAVASAVSLSISGTGRALGSLVSLLAAMVGAENDLRRNQKQQHRLHKPSHPNASHGIQGIEGVCGATSSTSVASSPSSVASHRTTPVPLATTKAIIPLSDGLLRVAFVVVRVVNLAFLHDIHAMQGVFSAEEKQPEFVFLCDRLLDALMERIDAQENAPPSSKAVEMEAWLEGLLTLVGYFCLGSPKHQQVLREGPSPSILSRLCTLPFRYFLEPRHRAALFPTLISACYESTGNRVVAENDLAMEWLADFLKENVNAHQADKLSDAAHDAEVNVLDSLGRDSSSTDTADTPRQPASSLSIDWRAVSRRFPSEMWEGAIRFFRSSLSSSPPSSKR